MDGWILYHLLSPVLHQNAYAIQAHVNVIMLHHCTLAVLNFISLAALFPSFKQNLMFSLCLSTGEAKLPAETSQGTLQREAVQV
jgi:hypothetical protein